MFSNFLQYPGDGRVPVGIFCLHHVKYFAIFYSIQEMKECERRMPMMGSFVSLAPPAHLGLNRSIMHALFYLHVFLCLCETVKPCSMLAITVAASIKMNQPSRVSTRRTRPVLSTRLVVQGHASLFTLRRRPD